MNEPSIPIVKAVLLSVLNTKPYIFDVITLEGYPVNVICGTARLPVIVSPVFNTFNDALPITSPVNPACIIPAENPPISSLDTILEAIFNSVASVLISTSFALLLIFICKAPDIVLKFKTEPVASLYI